jgi:hypothetical protein
MASPSDVDMNLMADQVTKNLAEVAAMVDDEPAPPWRKSAYHRPEGVAESKYQWTKAQGVPDVYVEYGITEDACDFMDFFTDREKAADKELKRKVINWGIRPLQHNARMKSRAGEGGWVTIDEAVATVMANYANKKPPQKRAQSQGFIRKLILEFIWSYRLEFRNKSIDDDASAEGDVRISAGYLKSLNKSPWDQHSKPIMRAKGHMFKYARDYGISEKLPMETDDEFHHVLATATGINFREFSMRQISEWMQTDYSYEWDEDKCAYALLLNHKYDTQLGYRHFICLCDNFPPEDTDFSTMQPNAEQMSMYRIWKLGSPVAGQTYTSFLQDLIEWKDCTQQGLEGEIKRRANAWDTTTTKDPEQKDPDPDKDDQPDAKKSKTTYVQDPTQWQDPATWENPAGQKPYTYTGQQNYSRTANSNWGWGSFAWGPPGPSSGSAGDSYSKGKGQSDRGKQRIDGF